MGIISFNFLRDFDDGSLWLWVSHLLWMGGWFLGMLCGNNDNWFEIFGCMPIVFRLGMDIGFWLWYGNIFDYQQYNHTTSANNSKNLTIIKLSHFWLLNVRKLVWKV